MLVDMDAAEIRAAQALLKERYREDPEAALTPTHARGTQAPESPGFAVDQFSGITVAGLHRATGGDGTAACSADMLLEAVLGCAGVTLRAVATAMGVELTSIRGRADAVFDARGTLGVARGAPVGVRDLEVAFEVETDAGDETLDRLVAAVDRYCVVGQSLATPPRIVLRRAAQSPA